MAAGTSMKKKRNYGKQRGHRDEKVREPFALHVYQGISEWDHYRCNLGEAISV